MLQAAHCKILHFKCIELKRLWDYLEKLLIYCWPLNFTHLPSDWAPQLRLEHIFWKDILTWDELNFLKKMENPQLPWRELYQIAHCSPGISSMVRVNTQKLSSARMHKSSKSVTAKFGILWINKFKKKIIVRVYGKSLSRALCLERKLFSKLS